ncbi:MAG: TonB-dependent receptor [Sphingobacteriaceae bacterium]|nr:TonB-dependent receptor [Sphingobacteriaceae bacterium]
MTKFLSALFLFISFCSISQNGKITGKIIDAKTGETLPGATAVIEGTTKGASADFDGNFSLNNVPAGKVNIIFSYISYDSKKFTDVEIKTNDVTNINVQLEPSSSTTFSEVVVVVEMIKENNAALTMMQKNNVSVSDGVSAETIKRTPDRNTADVLKRISGVTIIDDKFVVIRGLNERYNVSYLNNSPLPNTEADKKAFSFDIFPANMLDNITVNKTATPESPGDFAGGIVFVNTKNIPDKNFISLSVSGGYNTITTGKDRITYQGGKYDWIGLDDGTRNMPSDVPSSNDFPQLNSKRGELAKYFKNDWALRTDKFDPNLSAQFAIGHNVKRKEKDFFGVLFSLTYNNSKTYSQRDRYAFSNNTTGTSENQLDDKYLFETFNTQTLAASILNFSFKLNENHSISFKNIGSISSDNKLIHSNGSTGLSNNNPAINDITTRFFKNSTVYSGQLIGEHYMPKLKLKTNWVGSYGKTKRTIPNYRTTSYSHFEKPNDPEDPYSVYYDTMRTVIIANAGSGPDYAGYRLYSKLDENIKSFRADVSRSFKISENFTQDVKIGGFYQLRNRTFFNRQLGLVRSSSKFKSSLMYLPADQIFDEANMGQSIPSNVAGYPDSSGFLLYDMTKPSDVYDANSSLFAHYIMLTSKVKEWFTAVYGLRIENFTQVVNGHKKKNDTLQFVQGQVNYLPSVNLIFALNSKQNIRASYSKTLNRPEFRELAPFNFFDPETRLLYNGNDTLQQCSINNYDLRYEIYPGRGQLLSVSGFYKDFKNPIELAAQEYAADELTYRNAPKAIMYGAELEFRVILGALFKTDSIKFLNNLSLFSNLSYIKSKVEVFVPGSTTEKVIRPLQGQSPYIINAGIVYNDTELGYSVSAMVNRIGERIFNVGTTNEPHRWENGRTALDFQASKSFLKNKLEVRFTAKDILHQKLIFYQNGDKDNAFDKNKDFINFSQTYGTVYALQISFKL